MAKEFVTFDKKEQPINEKTKIIKEKPSLRIPPSITEERSKKIVYRDLPPQINKFVFDKYGYKTYSEINPEGELNLSAITKGKSLAEATEIAESIKKEVERLRLEVPKIEKGLSDVPYKTVEANIDKSIKALKPAGEILEEAPWKRTGAGLLELLEREERVPEIPPLIRLPGKWGKVTKEPRAILKLLGALGLGVAAAKGGERTVALVKGYQEMRKLREEEAKKEIKEARTEELEERKTWIDTLDRLIKAYTLIGLEAPQPLIDAYKAAAGIEYEEVRKVLPKLEIEKEKIEKKEKRDIAEEKRKEREEKRKDRYLEIREIELMLKQAKAGRVAKGIGKPSKEERLIINSLLDKYGKEETATRKEIDDIKGQWVKTEEDKKTLSTLKKDLEGIKKQKKYYMNELKGLIPRKELKKKGYEILDLK